MDQEKTTQVTQGATMEAVPVNRDNKPKRGRPKGSKTRVEQPNPSFSAVDHKPARCPNCGCTCNKVTTTRHPAETVIKRHHKCASCGITFASVQQIPETDRLYYQTR